MKRFVGTVVRVNTLKTAHVTVVSEWMHPKYLKKKKVSSTFACHDEVGVGLGDEVSIVECRPLSATKYFKIETIVKKGTQANVKVKTLKSVKSKKATKKKN